MKTASKKKNNAGFTLVELMVVAVIVAILAAVAIPLMSANKRRAMATEAESALGTIRSTLRANYAETSSYLVLVGDSNPLNIGARTVLATELPGITVGDGTTPGDLDGRYFSEECYSVNLVDANTYLIIADGDANNGAQEATQVADTYITLNQNGDFTRTF